MINLRRGSSLFAAVCCLAAVPVQAQPASQSLSPNPDPRDFSGMWKGAPTDHGFAAGFTKPPEGGPGGPDAPPPPTLGGPIGNFDAILKPAAKARSEHELNLMLKGTTVLNWRVVCRPSPPQGLLSDDLGGFEIVQTPTRVLFLLDTDNTYWEVHLDSDHPKNLKPSYLGHSVGHWEGNKLVVDTVGYNGRGSLLRGAVPSTQAHTITRLWKEDGGRQIKYETTLEDPVNLTAPANFPVAAVNWTPEHRIYEEHCTQNPRPENITDMLFEDFTREEAFPFLYKKK